MGIEEEEQEKSCVEIELLFEEYIDFEVFSKSHFRVVRIKDCKEVPKSRKLLQFTLDDGIPTGAKLY